MVKKFAELVRLLRKASVSGPVVIQTHDFPDHDAAAAAFALSSLLARKGFGSRLFYRGAITSYSLRTMISELEIPLKRVRTKAGEDLRDCPCILVDGNPLNSNAKPVTANLFGVVDHHPAAEPEDCPFTDIRTGYGSCASIAADYWEEAGLKPERNVATALIMGIEMDTDFLSRRVSRSDIDALHRLFFAGDWEFGTRVVKTSLSKTDLPVFERAVSKLRIYNQLLFSFIPVETSQEVISIVADFFLRFREILVTVIIESEGAECHVSVRSRDPGISAAKLILAALEGIGEGGGHDYMAGGLLYEDRKQKTSEEELFRRFTRALDKIGRTS
jgi:nanoRNase/pAp phosphatase (c-di-AMP/oligoRNAs hydrolase)